MRAKGRLKEGVIPIYLNQHENERINEPICTVGYERAPLFPSRGEELATELSVHGVLSALKEKGLPGLVSEALTD